MEGKISELIDETTKRHIENELKSAERSAKLYSLLEKHGRIKMSNPKDSCAIDWSVVRGGRRTVKTIYGSAFWLKPDDYKCSDECGNCGFCHFFE